MANVRPTVLKLLSSSLLAFAASLVLAAGANAGCGQEYRGAPAHSAVAAGPPLAIGDSVLADAVPTLVRYGFEADGMVCRQMSQGIAILRERGSALPHLVVLALGANGPVTRAEIDEALTLLGPTRILALVTPHGGVSPSAPEVMRAAAAENPRRIVLLDWDRLAGERPDWLAPDGVHLGGAAGIEGFASVIAGALPYAGAPTTTPTVTATPKVESEAANADPGTPRTLSPPSRAVHQARTAARGRDASKNVRARRAARKRVPRSPPARGTSAPSPRRAAAGHEETPVELRTPRSAGRAPEKRDQTAVAVAVGGAAGAITLAGLFGMSVRRRRRVAS